MLFYQTVNSGILELLRRLQGIKAFNHLSLAGGTALALQIGHRKSIGVDLFGKIKGDEYTVTENLQLLGR